MSRGEGNHFEPTEVSKNTSTKGAAFLVKKQVH